MNLLRDTKTFAETLGRIGFGTAYCECIEQPDNHDMPGHSCVPAGTYTLVPHTSARLKEEDGKTPLRTWALVNPALGITHAEADAIPGGIGYPHRSECLIHPANYANQLEGCIAPGQRRAPAEAGTHMVTKSRDTFEAIRAYLDANPDDRTLVITDAA